MAGTVELAQRFVDLGPEPEPDGSRRWLLWHCRRERLFVLWYEGHELSRDVHVGRLQWFQSELRLERADLLESRRLARAGSF